LPAVSCARPSSHLLSLGGFSAVSKLLVTGSQTQTTLYDPTIVPADFVPAVLAAATARRRRTPRCCLRGPILRGDQEPWHGDLGHRPIGRRRTPRFPRQAKQPLDAPNPSMVSGALTPLAIHGETSAAVAAFLNPEPVAGSRCIVHLRGRCFHQPRRFGRNVYSCSTAKGFPLATSTMPPS
jgi:hypothetical protein